MNRRSFNWAVVFIGLPPFVHQVIEAAKVTARMIKEAVEWFFKEITPSA